MSAVYSVHVKYKAEDEKKAYLALKDFVDAKTASRSADFRIHEWKKKGIPDDTLDGLVRIVFLNENNSEQTTENGYTFCHSDYNASYGWKAVLMEAFQSIRPYLEHGSAIKIAVWG